MKIADSTMSAAVTVHPTTGVIERAEFVDVGDDRVYVHLTVPKTGHAGTAVVVCSPYFAEFPRNYRREVLLARHLARSGVAVARLHHRGFGNSTGDPASVNLDRLIEDARTVAAYAKTQTSADRLVYHGTRLASFVAVGSAGHADAVSLWEPVVRSAKYFNEVFRTRMVQALHDDDAQTTVGELRAALVDGGQVDVLGHSLHHEMYRSLRDLDLDAGVEDVAAVSITEFGRVRKDVVRLITAFEKRDVVVRHAVSEESESWWVANRRADYFVAEERRPLTRLVLAEMADWLAERGWSA
jgi:alpha/beta superfamily hydrolase